jgi:hypothetical protein
LRNFTVATAFAFAIAAMFALSSAKAEDMLKSSGKCWMDDHKANYGWSGWPARTIEKGGESVKGLGGAAEPTTIGGGRY